MAKTVEQQISAILAEYQDDCQNTINKITKEVAEDVKKDLRRTSPKSKGGGKHYANGWAVQVKKLAGQGTYITVYNKTKPQLTHLLERSHRIKNQYDEYGMSTPKRHIEPAEQRGIKKYLHRLETEL